MLLFQAYYERKLSVVKFLTKHGTNLNKKIIIRVKSH